MLVMIPAQPMPFQETSVVSRNRIAGWLQRTPQAPSAASGGFMACPPVLFWGVGDEQRRLYQWAMEQAAAVVRPSVLERFQADLLN